MPQASSRLTTATKTQNPSAALQFLLVLDIWVRLMIWAVALAVTLLVLAHTTFVRSLS